MYVPRPVGLRKIRAAERVPRASVYPSPLAIAERRPVPSKMQRFASCTVPVTRGPIARSRATAGGEAMHTGTAASNAHASARASHMPAG
jgi:hypothetical protein